MDDLISRQAAIDELNEQIECCDKALGSFDIALKDEYAVKVERASLIAYKEQLEAISAADVVPVVRCEDCKHHSFDAGYGNHWCNLTSGVRKVKPDDFCSYGERKE